MTIEEALIFLDTILCEKGLSNLQELVLRQCWEGQSYAEISENFSYDHDYIRNIGFTLWRTLSEALGEKVTKSNVKSVIRRHSIKTQSAPRKSTNTLPFVGGKNTNSRQDWGEAIDVSFFYGRTQELTTLTQSIVQDRCRLITLFGMGGIGKTALAVKLAQQIWTAPPLTEKDEFEYIIWRSLRNAPTLETLLADLVPFLSNQQETKAEIPQLLQYLRTSRCMVILDNWETILDVGCVGKYRPGYEGYGELLKVIGETAHQSCLIITSREKPGEMVTLEGLISVQSMQLRGTAEAAFALLQNKSLSGSEVQKQELGDRYGNNPLALKIVATSIQDLFDGDIGKFLEEDTALFNGIRHLLDQQFHRLSPLERTIMYWLAINREWTTIAELQSDIIPAVSKGKLLAALEGLNGRSLIEKKSGSYTQQPVVMEYVTDQLIEQVCGELATDGITDVTDKLMTFTNNPSATSVTKSAATSAPLFLTHALIKTTVKDYIRESQCRLILGAIANQLRTTFTSPRAIEEQLQRILVQLRASETTLSGYGGGNLINLCNELQIDLTGYDFSGLTIWQAYLYKVNLHLTNFTHSNFAKSVFTQNFGGIKSVTFSPDGELLATGDTNGTVYLWQVASGQLLSFCRGHTSWVHSLSFSPDGKTLASGSTDQTIKLWDTHTGQCLKTLQGHTNVVLSVAWNPNGQILASGSHDQTAKLWDTRTGKCCKTLQGHTNQVWSVAWSPDGQVLASGAHDQTVRLWNPNTGQCLKILQGHKSLVCSVAWNPDGQTLASGCYDQVVRLWDIHTGECIETLQGHTNQVWSVAWSPDGKILASSSHDQTVRLWNIDTGHCLQTLQGHTDVIFSVTWSSDGLILASGSDDQRVRLWDTHTGECLKTLQGYTSQVWSVAWSLEGQTLASSFDDQIVRLWDTHTGHCIQTLQEDSLVLSVVWSPNGQTLASSNSYGKTVKLWDIHTGECFQILQGHTGWIFSIAWNRDGQTLASGSTDQTLKLWDTRTGQCLKTLPGHTHWVWSVAWSHDGEIIASGSLDQTVKLWDTRTGECFRTLYGHTHSVCLVAWHPDGQILASSSYDQTIKLWDRHTGECLKTLHGHTDWVWSVAWHPNGQILASASQDQTIKLWDIHTGKCLKTLQGHTNWIRSVAWSPDGQTLASGGGDETIKLWDVKTGECVKTLRAKRPYEGMNITGIRGITEAQKVTLKALGAVEI